MDIRDLNAYKQELKTAPRSFVLEVAKLISLLSNSTDDANYNRQVARLAAAMEVIVELRAKLEPCEEGDFECLEHRSQNCPECGQTV